MSCTVLFLHGPPAAGKHTIGQILAGRLGWPLFHNHLVVDLASSLFEFGTPQFVELRASMWLVAFQQAARAGRSFVFTFNPEASVAPELIDQLNAVVADEGGHTHYVAVTCPREQIRERLGAPSRGAFGKLTDVTLYDELVAQGVFDFPELPTPLITVDSGQLSADASADAVLAAYRSAEND